MPDFIIRGPKEIGDRSYQIQLAPEVKKGVWYAGKTLPRNKPTASGGDNLTDLLREIQTPQKWSVKPDNEYWLGKNTDYGDRSIFRFDSLSKTDETYNLIFDVDGIHVLDRRDYLKQLSPNEKNRVINDFVYQLKTSKEGATAMRTLTDAQLEQVNSQILKYVKLHTKNQVPPADFL